MANELTRSRMAELMENKRQLEASIAEENIKRKDYSDEKIAFTSTGSSPWTFKALATGRS